MQCTCDLFLSLGVPLNTNSLVYRHCNIILLLIVIISSFFFNRNYCSLNDACIYFFFILLAFMAFPVYLMINEYDFVRPFKHIINKIHISWLNWLKEIEEFLFRLVYIFVTSMFHRNVLYYFEIHACLNYDGEWNF